MKGEKYLRVQLGLPHSDAARILERHLGERMAWAYTHQMWDWFARRHPSGEVTGPDAAYLIAKGSGWEGEADKFCAAQVLAGFLAPVTEGFRVRGWEKWAGYYFTVQAKERDKKASQRKGQDQGRPGEVPGTSQGQSQEEGASEGPVPGTPLYSPVSKGSASEGVQGEARRRPARARLVSPFPEGQDPYPQTTMVQAALFERGIDSAPPAAKSAARVEAAIVAAGFEAAVERLAVVLSDPEAPRPLTYHVDAIRAEPKPKRAAVGDLGTDLGAPWHTRLTREEAEAFEAERHALAPEMDGAPLSAVGPDRELVPLIDRYRAMTEGRNA